MMHPGSGFGQCIRLFCLAALFAFATGPARADNYAPVNQLLRDGQLSEAMAKAEQYLATNPRDPQMRFLKGLIQQDGGQREAAILTYESLIQDYPELPEPYNNVAVLYASQGLYFTSLFYVVLILMAVSGWRAWSARASIGQSAAPVPAHG